MAIQENENDKISCTCDKCKNEFDPTKSMVKFKTKDKTDIEGFYCPSCKSLFISCVFDSNTIKILQELISIKRQEQALRIRVTKLVKKGLKVDVRDIELIDRLEKKRDTLKDNFNKQQDESLATLSDQIKEYWLSNNGSHTKGL